MTRHASRSRRTLARAAAAVFVGAALGGRVEAQTQPAPGEYFYLLRRTQADSPGGFSPELRGTYTGSLPGIALTANAEYELWILQRGPEKRVGTVTFRTGPNGSRFSIPSVPLRASRPSHDADGDFLSDLQEAIIGSDPLSADSDGDLIPDETEFLQGSDLGAVTTSRTGILASVDTPGEAQDIEVNNDLAVVCDGLNGVVCANVFNLLPPQIVARVDTPGIALRSAVTASIVAVADGPGGLQVIDISDPPAARIVRSVPSVMLGGDAQCVVAVANLAFVGLSTGALVTVELDTGLVLERVLVGGTLVDVVVAGDVLYALDANRLFALALRPGELQVDGSVASPIFASGSNRVAVANGVAYVTHGKGVNTFSLADPLSPTLITATNTPQFGWKELALNGSGLALAAVSPNQVFDGPHDVSLYDARDPTQTNLFQTTFVTPGVARSVSVYNGLCYTADHTSGLQVIGYLPIDRDGVAPTISLSTNGPTIDTAEEGQLLRVTAAVSDDQQVRNVEWYVNGVRVLTDGTYPFEVFLIAPTLDVRPSIVVRARASDTGGAATFSDELKIQLTPDSTAPRVVRVVPANNGLVSHASGAAVLFSEGVDPATVTAAAFTLVGAGADGALGTADDVSVPGSIDVRDEVKGVFLTTVDLPADRYRATLSGASDRAGNAVPTTTWEFVVYGSGTDADGDGLPDALEPLLALDPNDPDTGDTGTNDGDRDHDGDGLSNRLEVLLGYDPTQPDSRGDGVPDGLRDSDRDRLTDGQEAQLLTNPFSRDTDTDGFEDKDELDHQSDPRSAQSRPLRFAVTSLGLRNDHAPPLDTAVSTTSVRNDAAPDAINGTTEGPSFSLENQGSP